MKGRRGFTLIELLVVIAIIAVLAAILFPVFAMARKAAQKSKCESNMKQIGAAFKMYLSDWHDTYPTNRTAGGGAITFAVPLTDAYTIGTTPEAVETNGPNWVEALYKYQEPPTADAPATNAIVNKNCGAWECGAASAATYPTSVSSGHMAYITYAMNLYLVEQPEGVIKMSDHLMLARELDRHTARAECRPSGPVDPTTAVPINCFLNNNDGVFNVATNPKQHGMGSHILFADSHVGIFPANAWPPSGGPACQQDTDSNSLTYGAYFNYVTGGTGNIQKRIQLTP